MSLLFLFTLEHIGKTQRNSNNKAKKERVNSIGFKLNGKLKKCYNFVANKKLFMALADAAFK